MRPTAKDLAKAAGVSLATVDRILNDRPNFSKKSAAKVNRAIELIGFERNPAAVNLARNTTYRFRFILPQADDQYLEEIIGEIRAVNKTLKSEMVTAEFTQVPTSDAHLVANLLASFDKSKIDGVAIMSPEYPEVRDAILRLKERGIPVVRLFSGKAQSETFDFVGIDNYAAGKTAARIVGRFVHEPAGSVMVIAETMRAQDSIERRLGFDSVINESFPHLRVLPSIETHSDNPRTRRIVSQMLEYNKDIVAIYVLGSEAMAPIKCISEFSDLDDVVLVAHERTPFNVSALESGRVDAIIEQNPGHGVRSAVRVLKARVENREPTMSLNKLRIEILIKDNL